MRMVSGVLECGKNMIEFIAMTKPLSFGFYGDYGDYVNYSFGYQKAKSPYEIEKMYADSDTVHERGSDCMNISNGYRDEDGVWRG